MSQLVPLSKVAKGHIERVGKDAYLAMIKDNHGCYYELLELDPYSAQRAAVDFCALNGIALQVFTVAPDVIQQHLADISEFLDEHAGTPIKAQFPASMRRAV